MAAITEAKTNWLDDFRRDLSACSNQLPDKGLFFGLLIVWSALFHFWGNSVFGWVDTSSLFGWMYFVFDTSPDDEHGKLIPFVVLGLFWWKRQELMAVEKRIWWPALGLIVFALAFHVLGFAVQQTRISIVAYFTGVYGLMGLIWGPHWLRASFFPMFLFAFCIPLASASEPITFPLRMLATNITAVICSDILGIPLIQDGVFLFDRDGRFRYEVAAACGGIRSLIAMLALSTLFAFMQFKSSWRRATLMASAFPLAVVGNVFRLVSIVVAAEAFGREAGDFVHEKLSLLPYVPALAGMVLLAYWMNENKRGRDKNPDRERQ